MNVLPGKKRAQRLRVSGELTRVFRTFLRAGLEIDDRHLIGTGEKPVDPPVFRPRLPVEHDLFFGKDAAFALLEEGENVIAAKEFGQSGPGSFIQTFFSGGYGQAGRRVPRGFRRFPSGQDPVDLRSPRRIASFSLRLWKADSANTR